MIIWSPYRLQSNRLWEVILSVRRSVYHPSFTSCPSFFLLSHHSLTVSLFLSPLCVWHTALTDRLKGKGSSVLSAGDRTTQATIWQSVLHCLSLIIQTNHTYKHEALCRKSRPWGVKMVWVYFALCSKKWCMLLLTIRPTVLRPRISFIICSTETAVAFVLILQSAVFTAYAPSWFQGALRSANLIAIIFLYLN